MALWGRGRSTLRADHSAKSFTQRGRQAFTRVKFRSEYLASRFVHSTGGLANKTPSAGRSRSPRASHEAHCELRRLVPMWARRSEILHGKVRYASLPSAVSFRAGCALNALHETADGKEAYRTFPFRISPRRAHISTRRLVRNAPRGCPATRRLRPATRRLARQAPRSVHSTGSQVFHYEISPW